MPILPFHRRSRQILPSRGSAARATPQLFFLLPEPQRRARIRQLMRSGLSTAQVASICHITVSEIEGVLEQPLGAA